MRQYPARPQDRGDRVFLPLARLPVDGVNEFVADRESQQIQARTVKL